MHSYSRSAGREGRLPAQSGRTAVVTGANSGLGLVSAKALAAAGAYVVLAVRDTGRGERARREILADRPDGQVEVRRLDLADLDSVREFAADLPGPVHLLMNNAGTVMAPQRQIAPIGVELQLAANHFGHFALTGLLLDRMPADARVVTVSSVAHRQGSIDFADLDASAGYSPGSRYADSKLANVLFGLELHRRLSATGSTVRSVLAHPGYARTNLAPPGATGFTRAALSVLTLLFAHSAQAGARCQLAAATEQEAASGQFIGPRLQIRGRPAPFTPAPPARDTEVARRLWVLSQKLTGVRYLGD